MGKSMSDNRINKNQPVGDELHEECGVFGMYDFDGGDVASTIYYGLFALQHRGTGELRYCSQRDERSERESDLLQGNGTGQ